MPPDGPRRRVFLCSSTCYLKRTCDIWKNRANPVGFSDELHITQIEQVSGLLESQPEELKRHRGRPLRPVPQTKPEGDRIMKVKTNVKAGGFPSHNETVIRD